MGEYKPIAELAYRESPAILNSCNWHVLLTGHHRESRDSDVKLIASCVSEHLCCMLLHPILNRVCLLSRMSMTKTGNESSAGNWLTRFSWETANKMLCS